MSRPSLIGFGLLAGFTSAVFGIGGGLLLVPLLTLKGGLPLKVAVGTSLAVIAPTALVGVVTESIWSPANQDLLLAGTMVAGAMAGTYGGKWILARVSEPTFRVVYAIFLIIAALRLMGVVGFLEGGIFLWKQRELEALLLLFGAGVLAGLTSTMFGIGGGVVMVPMLLIFFTDISYHLARGTSLLTIVPTATLGILHHHRMGSVKRDWAWPLMTGSVGGVVGGVFLVQEYPGEFFQKALSLVLVLAAWQLLRRTSRA